MNSQDRRYLPSNIITKLVNYLGDVMFILLGGSHLTKTDDEESDRDFIAVVHDRRALEYFQFCFALPDQGNTRCTLGIHCIEDFYDNNFDVYPRPLTLHIKNVISEDFIWVNPEYEAEKVKLLEEASSISLQAAETMLHQQSNLVKSLLENYHYEKWHYHLFFAYEVVSGEYIPRNILCDMKRGRSPKLCLVYLTKIESWLKNHPIKH